MRLQAAGLANTVSNPSFVGTILAPTNEAFAAYTGPTDAAAMKEAGTLFINAVMTHDHASSASE